MNKKQLIPAALLALLAACGNPKNNETAEELTVIDVESAMGNLQELKISDLGSHVRYIPLESNDSCLIGSNPHAYVVGSHILVTSTSIPTPSLHCFDKETGKFICTIGHWGDDPTGYWNSKPYYNPSNGLLYLKRLPNQLQKYDLQGRYHGKTTVPFPSVMNDEFTFLDTLLVVYHEPIYKPNKRILSLLSEAGASKDSVLRRTTSQVTFPKNCITSAYNRIGSMKTDLHYYKYKDGSIQSALTSPFPVWECEGHIRVQEGFNDTIYTLEENRLVPAFLFETGKRTLSPKDRLAGKSRDKLTLLCALETPNILYFQYIAHIFEYTEEFIAATWDNKANTVQPELLQGIFDKQTGVTRMAKGESLEDDLNGFLPFAPQSISLQGEYVGLLKVEDVLNFLDEHPEAKDNPALAPLLQLKEDDNPVVVLVE